MKRNHISKLFKSDFLKKKKTLIVACALFVLLFSGVTAFAVFKAQDTTKQEPVVSQEKDQPAPPESKEPSSEPVATDNTNTVEVSGETSTTKEGSTKKSTPPSTPPVKETKNQASNPQSSQSATTNPYCPTPNFSLSVSRQSPNDYNLRITASIPSDDPNLSPYCGGGLTFTYPEVTHPSNGAFCSGQVYPMTNTTWGVACSMYGNVPYGTYTFSFSTTGTNGYGKSTTRTATHTFNYVQQ